MNNISENTEVDLKKAKTARTIRIVWMILIALFGAVILWNLYNYTNGKDNLRSILSPLGMVFLGIASLLDDRSKTLKSILLGVAMILVITGLVLVIVY
ncbi:MAG: hypothetical protein M3Q99_11930 [Acidobacteriota bacterium]|nr:hypothetical protein [Acidobacteriota bacterium]